MKKYIGLTIALVGFLLILGAAGASDNGAAMRDFIPQALIGTSLLAFGVLWGKYEEEKERMQDNG